MNRTVGYWTCTTLIALALGSGGITEVMRTPEQSAGMQHLGYPMYFVTLLGVWKLLGALAILAPGLPRLKEWAYAGIVFDFSGAAVSHLATHDPVWHVAVTLSLTGVAFLSWWLRPADRKL